MKKHLLVLCGLFMALTTYAQNSIPNGNFETWNSGTYDIPLYFTNSSNPEAYFKCKGPFNLTKSTDSYHGTYAIQITTNASSGDTCGGYVMNATDANGNPSSWKGGIPYNQQATGMRGYYKYNVATADSALLIVSFRKAGSTIGSYFNLIGGIKSTYTLFNITFSPALAMAPDSVIFAVAASNLISGEAKPGSTLLLDSISFTGVSSQPALLNGDFELWQSHTLYSPVNWNLGSGREGNGFDRTTDAAAGTYAMELRTFLGDNNSVPQAQAGQINNGEWSSSCNCYKGGNPFSNQVDTLRFAYKYTPAIATDSAIVSLNFKKNKTSILSFDRKFGPSSTYTIAEVPLNLGIAPDSVIISLQSSGYNNKALGYVGAIFKVDAMAFKSQLPTSIKENTLPGRYVTFYPNPVKTSGTIEINPEASIQGMKLRMYNVLGKTILETKVNSHSIPFNRSDLSAGIYFYELMNPSNILETGKVIIE